MFVEKIYKMGCLEDISVTVLYIGRTVHKGLTTKYLLRLTQQVIAQKVVLLYFIFKATCFGYCHL
jgi:hypothetical protein